MPSRRQFIQGTAAMAAIATLGPALPALAVSEQGLLQRAIPSTGELLPAVGLGTSRTLDVSLEDDKRSSRCWRWCARWSTAAAS